MDDQQDRKFWLRFNTIIGISLACYVIWSVISMLFEHLLGFREPFVSVIAVAAYLGWTFRKQLGLSRSK